jgi:hypothetical protein
LGSHLAEHIVWKYRHGGYADKSFRGMHLHRVPPEAALVENLQELLMAKSAVKK